MSQLNQFVKKVARVVRSTTKRFYETRVGKWYKRQRRLVRISIALPTIGIAFSLLFYLAILIGIFGPVPREKDFVNLETMQATRVLGSDNELIGKFYEKNRDYIPLSQIPKHLINSLIATEDVRFRQHSGIDTRAFFRVLIKTIAMNKGTGGGSTLSQQLVKNVFGRQLEHGSLSILVVKIKEMIGAKRLERLYDKDKILELYFNSVPFGENVYGIQAASERFFSKKPMELSLEEGAVLIGMLKANTYYNPRLHPERSEQRRNVVLSLLSKHHYITDRASDSLKVIPIEIDYNRQLASSVKKHFLREVGNRAHALLKNTHKHNGEEYNLQTDGLRIYTTINPTLQQYAEESMKEHLIYIQQKLEASWGRARPWGRNKDLLQNAISQSQRYKRLKAKGLSEDEITKVFWKKTPTDLYYPRQNASFSCRPIDSVKHTLFQLRAGFVAVDNTSGHVLAWVGSPSHEHFHYDYVKAKRQVASTFKPIVYAAALEQGFEPCDFFRNEKITYSDYEGWSPENFSKRYGGKYSMKGALAKSVNVVAVDLLYKSKRENVIGMAQSLGIESEIPALPSIALGVADISLLEMTRAYSAFANNGHLNQSRLITRIVNRAGEVLYEAPSPENEEVLDAESAGVMQEMLKGVVTRGTGKSLKSTYKLETELAGKTGTSQSYSDGWFIGFSPSITAGVWVGGDNPAIRFRSSTYGQGSKMALPIFAKFMQKIEADTSLSIFTNKTFPEPSEKIAEMLDCPDFVTESELEKFLGNFRNKEISDDKLERRNRRKRFWKKIF